MASALRLAVIAIPGVSTKDREHMISCVDNDNYEVLQRLLASIVNDENKYFVEKAEALLPPSFLEDTLGEYLINN